MPSFVTTLTRTPKPSLLAGFFRANTRFCDWVEGMLPERFNRSLLWHHEHAAAREMNKKPGAVVLDIGGGHMAPFTKHRRPDLGTTIISTDILPEQLSANRAADRVFVSDAGLSLPLADGSVDLVVTRSVMEHVKANDVLNREAARVLKPGGAAVHVFPLRFAPFAILNQIMPNALVKVLMKRFFPEWEDKCGFRAFYANCWHPRFLKVAEEAGFKAEKVELRYYQSIYFKPFAPIYLLSLAYDGLVAALGAKPLACQMMVVLRKPEH